MALRKDEFHYEPEEQKQSVERVKSANEQQVVINMNSKLYNRVESEAHQHNQSLSDYIEDVLKQVLSDEEPDRLQPRPLTLEFLARVLEIHEQIRQSTNGRIFEDSTELIRQMREERSEELDRYLKGV